MYINIKKSLYITILGLKRKPFHYLIKIKISIFKKLNFLLVPKWVITLFTTCILRKKRVPDNEVILNHLDSGNSR